MNKKSEGQSFVSSVWAFLGSVKLTVGVLMSLAVTSIIGTLIPQNQSPEAYFEQYGEKAYRFLFAFQLVDMYHSWWYQLLILTLAVNIVICSVERFSATWKVVFVTRPKFDPQRFRQRSDGITYTVPVASDVLSGRYADWIAARFGYHHVETSAKGSWIFAEKGRWTRFGAYIVHVGVVLLLIGAWIGMLAGFDGFVKIPEGATVDAIHFKNSDQTRKLDFQIRCDDFNVSFYETGAPKEFRSTLSIIENGTAALKKDIIVNDPLRYKGINLYQSDYGQLPPDEATLTFEDTQTSDKFAVAARMGEPVTLPNGLGTFVLQAYKDVYAYKGHQLHDAFIGTWTTATGDMLDVVMPYPFPEFDAKDPESRKRISLFQITPRMKKGETPKEIQLTFTSNRSGLVYQHTLSVGEPVVLPEDLGLFVVTEVAESYSFRGVPVGEAVIGTLTHKSGETETVVLPVRYPGFDKMRKGDMVVSVVDFLQSGAAVNKIISVSAMKEKYYTGLQVTKDPGVWVVYCGFIAMIIGCYITFFMSHKQIFVEISPAGTDSRIIVAGTANKNKLGMRQYVRKLSRRLQKVTSGS